MCGSMGGEFRSRVWEKTAGGGWAGCRTTMDPESGSMAVRPWTTVNFVREISDRCTLFTEIEQSASSQQRARRYQPKSVNHCRLKNEFETKI